MLRYYHSLRNRKIQRLFALATGLICLLLVACTSSATHVILKSQSMQVPTPRSTPTVQSIASTKATPSLATRTVSPPSVIAPTSFAIPDVDPEQASPNKTNLCVHCWHPLQQTSWEWQLTGQLNLSINASMYDIDLFDNSAATVSQLHKLGRKVTCYLNAGAWEPYRSDAAAFPSQVKGQALDDWPDEHWLDIRNHTIIRPLMLARLDMCKAKGFDSVEFDLVNAFENESGFPITSQDQLDYNIFLANAAHQRGLSAALKQDPNQVLALVSYFDWGLSEECFQFKECELWLPFIHAGKPVMQVEYTTNTSQFCAQSNALNFNAMRMPLMLDGTFRNTCR